MSSYPLVKYVDAPAENATVRYDFNDQNPNPATSPVKKVTEFDPGVPTLEGDPDAVGQQWGFRSPSITYTIKGTKAQGLAALSAVSKEQLRRTNWVLFKPSAAQQAVWFKTYRTGYQPLTLEQVWVRTEGGGQALLPDTWKITVPLVADAFTYGAREAIATAQVIQAPADLAGPARGAMHIVLPAIKGDAQTGLRVALTPDTASGNFTGTPASSAWLVGCIAGSASLVDPIIDIGTGDLVTNISGTAAASVDATYFGGSFRTVTIGAATPNLLSRFRTQVSNTIPLGRYRVLLRCRYAIGGAQTLLFRFQQWPNGTSTDARLGPTVQVAVVGSDTGRNFWVDLGDLTLPLGITPPIDYIGTMPATTLAFDIGTASGAASSVNVDSIKLIPIDGPQVTRATLLKTLGPASSFADRNVKGILDADDAVVWSVDNLNAYKESVPVLRGAFPIADPAAPQNLLVVMALDSGAVSASGTNYISSLNAQLALDVTYYPRYLHVGDGT